KYWQRAVFFVGDEAFPLNTYMMRPYSKKSKSLTGNTTASTAQSSSIQSGATSQFEECHQKRMFSYWLSRARRVVEHSFGILAQKWRILRRPFKAKKKNTTKIVSACVALHNFLLKESTASRNMYCPPGTTDSEDWQGNRSDRSWRTEGVVNGALAALAGRGGNSSRTVGGFCLTTAKV
ncbi:uncharacterized protein LOC142775306, partial [Rhipicephalus microplus]|uniref:uncharacterized protein LOC142775306 n=1 Tax=Rhipicephalus microplus TaxID=6941 RepID=UPI003F6C023E